MLFVKQNLMQPTIGSGSMLDRGILAKDAHMKDP